MSLESLCSTHRITIQVKTVTKGSAGGMQRTWANQRTNVKCRVKLSSPSESHDLKQEAQRATPRVYFYFNPNVVTGEFRFIYVDKAGETHYLYVSKVENPHELNKFWKVDCEENKDVQA